MNRSRSFTVGRTGRVRGFGGLDPGTYLRWRKNVQAHERASSSVRRGAPYGLIRKPTPKLACWLE
jgi:hypothetical protein